VALFLRLFQGLDFIKMIFLNTLSSPQNHLPSFDLEIDGIDLFSCFGLSLFGLILIEGEIWPQEVFRCF
jgi:hypothetical protein